MKVDLAIYSHAVDVGGQRMSESLILGHNLDFSSCDIMVGFCKSSHISTLPGGVAFSMLIICILLL